MQTIEAIFENGVLRPTQEFKLKEGTKVKIVINVIDESKKDPAETIPDLAIDIGIPDFATNIDHYLYGLPKQSEK